MIWKTIGFFLALTTAGCLAAKQYQGWSLISVSPNSDEQVDFVRSITSGNYSAQVQVWQEGTPKRSFEVLVSPLYSDAFKSFLTAKRVQFTVKNNDIGRALEAEQRPVSSKSRALRNIPNGEYFIKYLRYDEAIAFIQQLASKYPSIMQIQSIGTTHRGKPITMIKIGTGGRKPGIWIDGGIHAREWISPATVLFIVNKLVTGYSTDAGIKKLVDSANFYIVPMLNADGYEHTHGQDRMWRKNRRPRGGQKCDGVDLNRNFDYGFGGEGTSANSCDETYRGVSAFSEPESQAVRDFVMARTSELKAFITIHAYAQMWFYPFGDKRNSYPSDVKELAALAQRGADALRKVYGTAYDVGSPADLLYPAAGGSDDWAKGGAKIKYVYCLELRPGQGGWSNGFVLPPDQIVPTGEETWVGLKVVFDEVVKVSSG